MICRTVAALFLLVWIAGVAMFFLSAGGAQWADLPAALSLTGLGVPWNLSGMMMGDAYGLRKAIVLLAPAINLFIVYGVCKLIARRICPNC